MLGSGKPTKCCQGTKKSSAGEDETVTGEIILETEGLTKEFRGFVAVNGVNLRIRRGTIHALIGPNGVGKTTCFKLLTKFRTPSLGRNVYKGRENIHVQPAETARIGLV